MGFVPYKRVKCTMPETQDIDNGVAKTFNSMQSNVLLGTLSQISDVSITSSDTFVEHNLGKSYSGFIVVRNNAAAVVYESPTVNSNPQDYAILRASANTTVTLLFY